MRQFVLSALFLILSLTLGTRLALASHYAIKDVPRLFTPADAEKLEKAGIMTTEQLLEKAGKSKDRKALAKKAGLTAAALTDMARRSDLLRIKGIGPEMVLLLEAAGVKSTAELAKKEAPGLAAATTSANQAKKISEKPPTELQLQNWIDQAKKLPEAFEPK